MCMIDQIKHGVGMVKLQKNTIQKEQATAGPVRKVRRFVQAHPGGVAPSAVHTTANY